jgi:hypothetical protein
MLVRGLGYTDDCNELKGMTWPTNFKVKAAELNITKNVDMSSIEADRGGVAQAMYNALEQQLVKVDADGDIIKEYRLGKVNGRDEQVPVKLVSRVAILKDTKIGFHHIDPEDKNYAGDKVDLTPYLFQTVEAYFSKNNDKEIVYVGNVENLTYTGEYKDLAGNILEVGDYKFNIDGASVSYNNDEATLDNIKTVDLTDPVKAKITVVLDTDETRIKDNAAVEGIIVEKASAYVQIEEVYEDEEVVIDEIFLPVKKDKVDSANLIVKGAVTELADIEEDDIVVAYAPFDQDPTVKAPDKLTLVVSRDTVEGKVTGTAGADYYIDRVKYKVNDALSVLGDFDIGDEGTFFLDDGGKIIAFVGESEGAKTYATVYDLIDGEYKSTSRGLQIVKLPKAKLNTASGERIEYEFDVEIKKGAFDGKAIGLFDTVSNEIRFKNANDFFEWDGSDVDYGKLVSFTLNKDGKITKFELVGRELDEVRTNSASFVLSSNAVIFNKDGKVINEDKLGSKVSGLAVYQNGKIVALLATDIDEEVIEYYAYITKVDKDTDDNGDEIQRLTAYINGAKDEKLFTDEEGLFAGSDPMDRVYALELNENGVVTDKANPAASTTGTAIDVDLKAGEFKIGTTKYYLEPGATIIEIDGDDIYVRNLNAIKNKEVEVYHDAADTNFKFIIFNKQ